MNEIGRRIASLSPEKRRLLENRLRERLTPEPPQRIMAFRAEDGPAPLASSQQRLWFLHQLDPAATHYNISYATRMTGRLDPAALEHALNAVVGRHEILRTVYASSNGEPLQTVLPLRPVRLTILDAREGGADASASAADALLLRQIHQPFDLTKDLMLRAALVKLSEHESVLLLTVHHIAADAWSFSILFRELAACYAAFTRQRREDLPELPIQYADFAVWQREWSKSDALARQLKYWTGQLRGLPVLQLPADFTRPPMLTYSGAQECIALPKGLSLRLKALAKSEQVTDYMLLLAAFNVLLSRYSGQEDVAVGSPIANRNRIELENLVGFFVNTLVMRTNLAGDPPFRELLGRVREMALDAYAHQDQPFEQLVAEIQSTRDRSRNPLFQVMFVLQNAPAAVLEFPGLKLAPWPLHDGASKFDLTLTLRDTADGFRGYLEYRTGLFTRETVARMARHFRVLLESLAADPRQRLSEAALLDDDERRQAVHAWNRTQRPYPHDRSIQQVFEEQAARTPEAVAVSHAGQALNYRELNERANQLAHYLRSMGVRPDVLVGLCVERSIDMVAATLAILKAGGAYLPLDPGYPRERLNFMLNDTRAPVLLTQQKLATVIDGRGACVICIDQDWKQIAREPRENPPAAAGAENLAYVIYTSGSTGKPKGICIPQKAVNRLVRGSDYVQLGAQDRVAQVSNISFDAATFELWGALLNGGRLVIIDKDIALSPRDFVARLRSEKITAMFLTTALFNLLIAENPAAFETLEHLLFGGEAVDPKRVREALQHGPPRRLLHVYGPTEVTTFATWHLIQDVAESASTVPIGRPIANTEAYILDRHGRPAPVGVPGELYLGGDGLARGYLNRPELSAEKFVPHPFSACPGERLYRSGDLARFRGDGAIEFIGRTDHQVKIRGFRIELGEVEAVLAQHPDVSEAVVLAREDSPGDRRVVAYVVVKQPAASDGGKLRRYLAEKMPEYMVPAAVVLLPALPLNANGKVDRNALPAPDYACADGKRARVEPWMPLHHQIARLWEELLGVGRIGITDDFFELGGHSLLAVRMMERIEQLCGRKLPLTTLFAGATIERLAAALVQDVHTGAHAPFIRLQPDGGKAPLFFMHGDFTGAGLYCLNLARHLGAEQPVYAFHPHGADELPRIPTIEAMAADHVHALREIAPAGPYYIGGFCAGGYVALEIARQLTEQGQRVPRVILIDAPPVGWVPRSIHDCIDYGGSLSGMLEHEKMMSFDRWMKRAERLAAFSRLSFQQKLSEAWHYFAARVSRSRKPAAGAARAGRSGAIPRQTALAYRWAIAGYRPRRYEGPVALIFSSDLRDAQRDPTLGWSALLPHSRAYTVPGDHLSCITRYSEDLAQRINICLAPQDAPKALMLLEDGRRCETMA